MHFIPFFTTILSIVFFVILYRHWIEKPADYNLWWMIGIFCYGAGTFTESIVTVIGWNELVFKSWYVMGAMFGGIPLAQGTIYLLVRKRRADLLAIIGISVAVIGAILCFLSPVDLSKVETYRLSGKVLSWNAVRYFPPLLNTYSLLFFVGGAAWSAYAYYKKRLSMDRCYGNVFIAIGGLLPGIGGTFTRYGYVEALYVTEFFGIILIYLGYLKIRNDTSYTIHGNNRVTDF